MQQTIKYSLPQNQASPRNSKTTNFFIRKVTFFFKIRQNVIKKTLRMKSPCAKFQ